MKAMISGVSMIPNAPPNPLELFLVFLGALQTTKPAMNLATIDPIEGVMARNVIYRGLENGKIRFLTEKTSRKYHNIKDNMKVALTFLMTVEDNRTTYTRQIRVNGDARELPLRDVQPYWHSQDLSSKISGYICDCFTPLPWKIIKDDHDRILDDYLYGTQSLSQTSTFTGFEVDPRRFEFYQGSLYHIADRVIYTKLRKGTWKRERICC